VEGSVWHGEVVGKVKKKKLWPFWYGFFIYLFGNI
jgi:hypothetical protein